MDKNDEDFVFWKTTGEEILQSYWKSVIRVLQQTPVEKIKEIYEPWRELVDKMADAKTKSDYKKLLAVVRARIHSEAHRYVNRLESEQKT